MNAYAERDAALRTMGFASYDDYLNSDLWRGISKTALLRAKRHCVGCRGRATEVHHTDYSLETLQGKRREYLKAICRECHELIEFNNGAKCSLRQANDRLLNLPAMFDRKRRKKERRQEKRQATPKPVYVPVKCSCGNTCKQGADRCRPCLRAIKRAGYKSPQHQAKVAEARKAIKNYTPPNAELILAAQNWQSQFAHARFSRRGPQGLKVKDRTGRG